MTVQSVRKPEDIKARPEALEATRAACEWLHGIAAAGVELGTTPAIVARWLENLGQQCATDLHTLGMWPADGESWQ